MDFSALIKAFGTNKELEREGAWVDYDGTIKVKLRRDTSPEYRKAFRKAGKRFAHLGSQLLPEQEDIILAEAAAKGLVMDWEGVGGPFTAEAAIKAFEVAPDFRRFCNAEAGNLDNFRDQLAEDEGNSSASLPGSESGEALNG